jgi:hypothetical protein
MFPTDPIFILMKTFFSYPNLNKGILRELIDIGPD